jgi:hypothetical protein
LGEANGNEIHINISIWARVTQVSDVAHGPLVKIIFATIEFPIPLY